MKTTGVQNHAAFKFIYGEMPLFQIMQPLVSFCKISFMFKMIQSAARYADVERHYFSSG